MKKKLSLIAAVLLFAAVNFSYGLPQEEETIIDPPPEAIDRIKYWKEHPEESPFEEIGNIHAIAVVVDATCSIIEEEYGIKPGDDCKRAIAQCILNRTTAVGFPNTIVEVCEQPHQWQGVNSSSMATYETTALVKKMIREGETGPIPTDNVFFVLSRSGIEFRDKWDLNGADITRITY